MGFLWYCRFKSIIPQCFPSFLIFSREWGHWLGDWRRSKEGEKCFTFRLSRKSRLSRQILKTFNPSGIHLEGKLERRFLLKQPFSWRGNIFSKYYSIMDLSLFKICLDLFMLFSTGLMHMKQGAVLTRSCLPAPCMGWREYFSQVMDDGWSIDVSLMHCWCLSFKNIAFYNRWVNSWINYTCHRDSFHFDIAKIRCCSLQVVVIWFNKK